MQSFNSTGIFLESSHLGSLELCADCKPGLNLVLRGPVLTSDYYQEVRTLARREPDHRLIIPLGLVDTQGVQRRAEELSLLGNNIYVQVPLAMAKQGNLVKRLLTEGVPLALTGECDRRVVSRVLPQLPLSTPVLLLLGQPDSYYDLVVSMAVTKLFPQVQLVIRTADPAALTDLAALDLDGVSFPIRLLDTVSQLQMIAVGDACQLA